MSSRAVGIAAGFALDRVFGDPTRRHPVAGFGRVAGALERRLYADGRGAGVSYTAVLVGGTALAGVALDRASRGRPVLRAALTAAGTWAVLGGRSLEREALAVAAHLEREDLPAARRRLTHLVGRDTTQLDASEVSRAVVESVAENTSDAVVAPLVWGAVTGLPGLLAYRAANTLDAMVGHRSVRYSRFGWASARLDDVLNVPGSRLTAALAAALAPTVGGRSADAVRAWHRDAAGHPSPNAGPVEAAFAGALGVRLGGVNRYGDRVEDRHVLGDGRAAAVDDVARAARLARWVDVAACVVAVAFAARAVSR
ncbi:cobalamin biosynthesis protein [Mumia zhuanghuii]|uniref:Cobalamin biosynthesis protein CobD n=1 Tax=Mumia zhuanghuii TaxID=2585211 RepID=A0A5Q6S249_9ACTN|nr:MULTISPECIES: cobalamin biosynthesis protein [Mumia]KAA1424452.1 cobalamin biosynthesis protein [Mumia zhuanghuii]